MEKKQELEATRDASFEATADLCDGEKIMYMETAAAEADVGEETTNNADCSDSNESISPPAAKNKKLGRMTTKAIAYTAVMTALVYVGSLIGYSSAQFYFNLGDAVILIAAALFNPVSAMLAGGLGSFFCDLTVYPATMVFTLFIKGIEGLLAGVLFKLINRWYDKSIAGLDGNQMSESDKAKNKKDYVLKIVFSSLAAIASVAVMMMGYFMCQSLFYGTVAGAIVALPFDAAQGAISATVSMLALYVLKLDNFRFKLNLKR